MDKAAGNAAVVSFLKLKAADISSAVCGATTFAN
jgi:hypothetical protein